MTRNPLINAGAAAVYIGAVVLFISSLSRFEEPETLLVPLAMISLLVLSVLVMSYCFFFSPIQMYLDGQKKEAVSLFTKSVAAFASIVAMFLGTLFFSL